MTPLPTFGLPLPQREPPIGYGWSDHELLVLSTTTAFNTRLNQRDRFLGRCRCIICGYSSARILEHCYIIMDSEAHTVSENDI